MKTDEMLLPMKLASYSKEIPLKEKYFIDKWYILLQLSRKIIK